jgi:CRISPR-associated exonuclease Cas4
VTTPHALMIVGAIALWLISMERHDILARLRRRGFTGRIIYSDADGNAPLLSSARYQLCGKPDWVIRERWGRLVPLEKKTRTYSRKTYPGEVFQLVAYALILEDISGRPCKLGRLVYDNRTIDVKITKELREQFEYVAREIRSAMRSTAGQQRSHEIEAKCSSCEFAGRCPQSLARIVVDPNSMAGDVRILRHHYR